MLAGRDGGFEMSLVRNAARLRPVRCFFVVDLFASDRFTRGKGSREWNVISPFAHRAKLELHLQQRWCWCLPMDQQHRSGAPPAFASAAFLKEVVGTEMKAEAASRERPAPVVTVLIVLASDTPAVVELLRHSN